MGQNIIETKNLHYKYTDGTCALNGINIGIEKGKTTAILGGNGAGKSTLFLNFNGILKPSQGEILFNNKAVQYSRSKLKELRKSVGIVFQDPDNQLFSASVFQDISFGAMNIKLPIEEVKRRVNLAMKRTRIEHLKDKPTHCLSYGQKKRVALAGVMVMEPEVLILDEPTAGLDPMGVSEIMDLLKDLQKELGLTIVISTHDIDIVPLYCDYSYVISEGKVLVEGTYDQIFNNIDEIRKVNLRLPRIGHLMEILKKEDGIKFQGSAYTISEARKVIKSLIKDSNTDSNIKGIVIKSGKELRSGYTTGSCAAAATKACASMLFEKDKIDTIKLSLPNGEASFKLYDINIGDEFVSASVIKDAGDDPDVTNGIKVYSKVRKIQKGILIDGGIGVGRVTSVGLPCAVGEAAINPGPKKIIMNALLEVANKYNYNGGFEVEIFVPEGVQIAKKTFNERLGIIGGISILGTSGIVEPMSEDSLVETIKLELNMRKKNGQKVAFVSPGNYGLEFAKENFEINIDSAVKCSNYIGEALDYCGYLGFDKILLVGHIGKIVKIAAGVMNTHSKIADCRNEIFASHTALCYGDRDTIGNIMNAKTTTEIHDILVKQDLDKKVYNSILEKILFQLNYRVKEKIQIEVIVFSNENGVLMKTENVEELIKELKEGII